MGDQVYADTSANSATSGGSAANSQTMGLLQANVSAVSTLENKNSKQTINSIDSNANVSIVADNAILPATDPLGASSDTNAGDPNSDQTSVYVVRSGDSLGQIAQMFGVSVNTILAANSMKKGDKIAEGEVLLILPISGVEHTVTKGETIQSIAKFYKVDANDVAAYNGIVVGAKLAVGDQIMIPGGDDMSEESSTPVSADNLKKIIAKANAYYTSHDTQVFPGYYIDPVPGYRLSQGIHDNNAVDLAIASGTPIHAAASGTVLLARYGYNGGFGNVVIIDHPNGTQTLYAHQSKLAIETGAEVTQGQVIGYVGSTGHSTGPHLHFEVHGARNPGVDDSWADATD